MINTIKQALESSFSYADYRKKIANLLEEGKSSGHEQSADLLHYSELNETRMHRLDKTIEVTPEIKAKLQNLDKKYIWLVLSEGWCGDAAQIVPVIHKMAEVTDKVELKIALRDDNDALMQQFLTNGGKSIPKLIALDADTLEVLFDWGPRPEAAQQLMSDYKAQHGKIDDFIKTELQKWYTKNKGMQIMQEVLALSQALVTA